MFFLPTWRRPERCQKTLDACIATNVKSPGIVIVQGDQEGYENLRLPDGWTRVSLAENLGCLGALRWAFKEFPDLDWYGFLTDDQIPTTEGWDTAIVEMAGNHKIASTHDGWQAPKRMHGATVWGGDLLRAAGFWVPDGFFHWYGLDDVWETIGRDMTIWATISEHVVQHCHHGNHRAKRDHVYELADSKQAEDAARWQEWLAKERYPTYQKIAPTIGRTLNMVTFEGIKVVIATPCYGGQLSVQYMRSLASTIHAFAVHGVQWDLMTVPNDSDISRARNTLVEGFLRSEGTHLWFIDADQGWNPDGILRLLATKFDFVAAAAPRKQMPLSFCGNLFDPIEIEPNTGCVRATEVGTGFVVLSRACVQKMWDSHPELEYFDALSNKKFRTLYEFRIEDGARWSEDYTFCRRWRALGGDIWVDPTIFLEHVGPYAWAGAFHDALLVKPDTGS